MSDGPPKEPAALPPPPELYEFPVQLLEQWIAIPPHERIAATLTKQDIDNLLLGLAKQSDAIASLDQTMVQWSNGEIGQANAALADSRRFNIEGLSRIRRFFTGLMVAALRGRSDG
jgi:hypothetical protein